MEEIIIRDKEQKIRFDKLYSENKVHISNDLKLLIKNVIIIFKRHSNNEELMVLALIYWLLYFSIIDDKNPILTKKDLENLEMLKNSFKYEVDWDYKKFLDCVIKMDKELFLLKTVIKYNILSFEKKFLTIVKNPINYYKAIWYIIPYLTYIESSLLWFFQDIYFKKVYPKKFEKIRKYYIDKINKVEFPWEHMFSIVNNLSDLMSEGNIIWKISVRRKTYFSIYNKLIRKKWVWLLDTIWMRIIFSNIDELDKFSYLFETKYVFLNKKDYINNPKENWYKSLHYKYVSPYRDTQILVELQLRTLEMDLEIKSDNWINHFEYTIKLNKWSKLFKEVHCWYSYIIKNNEIIKESETPKDKD